MKKILIILIISTSLSGMAWATCGTAISTGPTAWEPEYNKTGCRKLFKKASYGGTVTVLTDNAGIYQTSIAEKSILRQYQGDNPAVANLTNTVGLGCNRTTIVATWTTTSTCLIPTGPSFFTEYVIAYTDASGQTITKSVTSQIVKSQ